MGVAKRSKMTDALNEMDLILCEGCLCFNTGLYVKVPDCIGVSTKEICLCCTHQCCCKGGVDPLLCTAPEGHFCQLGCGICSYGCHKPETCCMSQAHWCCTVTSGAIPCTDEVPMTFALCGLACYPGFGCCKTLGELSVQVDKAVSVRDSHKSQKLAECHYKKADPAGTVVVEKASQYNLVDHYH